MPSTAAGPSRPDRLREPGLREQGLGSRACGSRACRSSGLPEQRRRDPRRRQRILRAAAELVAERGYHEVGMADIGAAAGITGPAIYRHFDGKSAVLVAMFDHVIDDLSREASEIVASGGDALATLRGLIQTQVRFVLRDRTLAQVYHNEVANLPDEDRQPAAPQAAPLHRGVGPRPGPAPAGRRRRDGAGSRACFRRRDPVRAVLLQRPG